VEAAQDASRQLARTMYPRLSLFARPRRNMREHALAAQIAKLSAEPI